MASLVKVCGRFGTARLSSSQQPLGVQLHKIAPKSLSTLPSFIDDKNKKEDSLALVTVRNASSTPGSEG